MRIGIFGGTFSPPHLGHLWAAQAAAEQLALHKVLVVPTYLPPHKLPEEDMPAPDVRLEMTKILFDGWALAQVSDLELCRKRVSYSADTVEQLTARYPDSRLFLLIGSDMLLGFETWHRYEDILKKAELAVFARESGEMEPIVRQARQIEENRGGRVHIIRNQALEISSTELRGHLQRRTGLAYLGAGLYAYIIANRLYGAKPDFDWLRGEAYAMLKPKRILHVQGCEAEAVRLAARWGADEAEARTAAILHDITKKLEQKDQLLLCEKYGIITDAVEENSEKLLHAKTAAWIAKACFGVSEAVFDAISCHTTGKPGMSTLDMVLYLADYIEPTRDFDGVKTLRRLAYADLEAAMRAGLALDLSQLRKKGVTPHERSSAALRYLEQKARGKGLA